MPEDLPLITIGLPTFNRAHVLPKVLDSVLSFDYSKGRLRICFVDNESSDGTMAIIEDFARAHGQEYEGCVVRSKKSNIPEARNVVYEVGEGTDYVFFLDSDVLAPPDVLLRLLGCFKRIENVGMAALPCDNKNAKKRAGPFFGAFRVPLGPHEAYKVATCCCLVSMVAYRAVGGFDPNLEVHEDSDFSFRVRKVGFKIISDSSEEGTHLKEISVNTAFYLRFLGDSAITYATLIRKGSALHVAKVVLSYALIAFFILLVLTPSFMTLVSFTALIAICVLLNSSRPALDDGAHTRPEFVPIIGLIFTVTTMAISLILIKVTIAQHRR